MPKDNKQKIKLLYLMEILRQDTDEEHPISTSQICKRLAEQGISCERRTVGMDMKVLGDYGYEIMSKMVGMKRHTISRIEASVFRRLRSLWILFRRQSLSHRERVLL